MPVYETCDSMRRQIRTLLKKDGVTQAAYLRAIAKCMPGEPSIQPRVLRDSGFLSHRGPAIGCKSLAFDGSYVVFEKRRINKGKPKSKFRQEMEQVHGDKGMDIEHDPRTSRLILHDTYLGSQDAFRDKYGKLHMTPLKRRAE